MAEQAQKDRFVVALAELGGSAGNGRLREALQWEESAYNAVKEELVAEGLVTLGRGRGGSVLLGGALEVDAEDPAPIAALPKPVRSNGNGGNLGFEADLFKAADKLRGNMEPSDYKHVALGLIFLKHISDSFEAKRAELLAGYPDGAEDPDEYAAENVFWVPKEARWSHLQASAKQPSIGKMIDEAMISIEKRNESLKGVLPKDYARPALNAVMLGELIDLISGIALGQEKGEARDVLGRVYEYFLGQFAGSEGKRGGEFYTPSSVVRVMVEMIEPYKGRVYDPCCGSGGMFVQSEKFMELHGGRIGDIAVYGQESNYTTWRLCKMNLAVRGIDADIRWNNEGSFHRDELRDLKADFILANPPFNISDWGGERLRDDVRWTLGTPPTGNANYAWLQHILHHLTPNGTAGVVLANGSLTSNQTTEGQIRRAMIEGDFVSCVLTLPVQLFYSTQISASIWFLSRNKNFRDGVDRRRQVLFIDARGMGHLVDRTRREFSNQEISSIAQSYRSWKSESYKDVPGFCRSVSADEISRHRWALVPGRYVGFDRTAISSSAIGQLESDFVQLKTALVNLPAEVEKSINIFEGLFNG
jgi:type I restriction enzyme M protein